MNSNNLTFNILPAQGSTVTVSVYSYYHGHLIETLLNHFDTSFSEGVATAQASAGDKVA